MFESSLRAVAANRNNVKAGTSIMRMITSGEYLSRPPESILLSMVDRLFRPPGAHLDARLDLDKHQRRPVKSDQVDLRSRRAEIARYNGQTLSPQKPGCFSLATPSKLNPMVANITRPNTARK